MSNTVEQLAAEFVPLAVKEMVQLPPALPPPKPPAPKPAAPAAGAVAPAAKPAAVPAAPSVSAPEVGRGVPAEPSATPSSTPTANSQLPTAAAAAPTAPNPKLQTPNPKPAAPAATPTTNSQLPTPAAAAPATPAAAKPAAAPAAAAPTPNPKPETPNPKPAASAAPAAPPPKPVQIWNFADKGLHLEVTVEPAHVVAAAELLDRHGFAIDAVTGMDWPTQGLLEVIYDFLHFTTGLRVAYRARIPRHAPQIPTISKIFPGADWHERETHDFFGIDFVGHRDLSPFMLPDDATYHPLLKDFKT